MRMAATFLAIVLLLILVGCAPEKQEAVGGGSAVGTVQVTILPPPDASQPQSSEQTSQNQNSTAY